MTSSIEERHGQASLVERMAEAAADWLASLSPDQRQKARFGFPAESERTLWYYTPNEQGGLPLVEMDPVQQRLAHRLAASGLSSAGYATAAMIMGLENVLDAVEGWRMAYSGRRAPNRGRDPLLYFVSVFGEPGAPSWGWRIGGHHVSVSHTIVEGRLASPTPVFFGANPAESRLVGSGVLRLLAGEEDLGRDLLNSLDSDQRSVALLSPEAPSDIVQTNRPFVVPGALPPRTPEHLAILRYETTPRGLAAAEMTGLQREVLSALIRQYVDRLPEEAVQPYRARALDLDLGAMHFAWAGGFARRQPHYYRVQGPRLLIEYDDTQNDADHIHAVLRDPEGDFGADLLARHYHEAH